MPPDLRSLAEYLETAGREARARGETFSALAFFDAALMARRMMDPEAARELRTLLLADQRGNTGGMVTAERVRVSKGRKQRDALVVAANTHNYTLRSLAEALKGEGFQVTHALLSQARPDAKGMAKNSIDGKLAKRIEELTGFRATRANWPKLRSE